MAKLDKKLAVERICAPIVRCDRLETGRCLAASDARKFWIQEKNDFGYPGNFEARKIFICHVCWNTEQTEMWLVCSMLKKRLGYQA